jgi:hypothetical protein
MIKLIFIIRYNIFCQNKLGPSIDFLLVKQVALIVRVTDLIFRKKILLQHLNIHQSVVKEL